MNLMERHSALKPQPKPQNTRNTRKERTQSLSVFRVICVFRGSYRRRTRSPAANNMVCCGADAVDPVPPGGRSGRATWAGVLCIWCIWCLSWLPLRVKIPPSDSANLKFRLHPEALARRLQSAFKALARLLSLYCASLARLLHVSCTPLVRLCTSHLTLPRSPVSLTGRGDRPSGRSGKRAALVHPACSRG